MANEWMADDVIGLGGSGCVRIVVDGGDGEMGI